MSTIVTIPANLSPQLLAAVHEVLGNAAKEVTTVAENENRPSHPEMYEKPIARLKQTCQLLDLIGWGHPPEPAAIQVDLRQHRAALLDALDMAVSLADIEVADIEARDTATIRALRDPTIARALALHELNSTITDIAASIDSQGAARRRHSSCCRDCRIPRCPSRLRRIVPHLPRRPR